MPRPRTPRPRFLTAGQGNGHGYRTTPPRELQHAPDPRAADYEALRREAELVAAATTLRDEPETVGPRWLEDYAQVADLHRSQQHAIDVANAQQLRPQLAAEDRVRDIQRRAKHAHVNLSREIFIMTKDLERARAGGRKPPPRTLDRIQRLEALLDGVSA